MLVVLLLWASGTPYAYSTGNGLASGGKPKKTKGGFEMKRKSFIGAVVLGALLVVFAGISQAGGVMHKSSGDEKPMKQTKETAQQAMRPSDFGESGPPLEYWEALGTGHLLRSDEGKKSSRDEKPMKQTKETAWQAFRPT